MFAVIFELEVSPDKSDEYFEIAGALREELDTIDGFISIERFESVVTAGKFVSLSFWRDEEAIKTWRTLTSHRRAQSKGRKSIFTDYRLRVAEVVRDYGMNKRDQAPKDSRETHN